MGTEPAEDIGVDDEAWDGATVRGLLRRLHEEHARGENFACYGTAAELGRYLRLVRLIVPQHTLWSVNVYRRCDFRCEFCDVWAQGTARPVLEGEALRRRLRLEIEVVPLEHHFVLSSLSDAYVPAEEKLGVARAAVEELVAAGRCVHVVTKGTAVLRDVDLIRRARCGKVEISLCTLDEKVAAAIEPGATTPAKRLALVDALAKAGIDVGISLAPWIPGVTDVAAIFAAAGPGRRITISPLKCNSPGGILTIAGRVYAQQDVNRRYREERERFEPLPWVKWEPPWQLSDHYTVRYRPLSLVTPGDSPFRLDVVPSWRQRVLRLIAASGVHRHAGQIHRAVYRLTAGRIGQRWGRANCLLLTTTGRRSGRPRSVPLVYIRDGSHWVVAASNGGRDQNPGWWLNLKADRRGVVEVAGTRTTVVAHEAFAVERARLCVLLRAANIVSSHREQMTARQIPVVVLRPVAS